MFIMTTYGLIDFWKFYKLRAGDRFSAILVDVRPGEMIIRFSCGYTYTAKSFAMPNAHIGDACMFLVKENDHGGRIVLEVVKRDDGSGIKKYDIRV